jgi:hypothetical protein
LGQGLWNGFPFRRFRAALSRKKDRLFVTTQAGWVFWDDDGGFHRIRGENTPSSSQNTHRLSSDK